MTTTKINSIKDWKKEECHRWLLLLSTVLSTLENVVNQGLVKIKEKDKTISLLIL